MINLVCILLDYFSKTHFVLYIYNCGALQYCMVYTDYCLAQNFDGENYVLKLDCQNLTCQKFNSITVLQVHAERR